MSTHSTPIVPTVLYIAEQHDSWKLAAYERLATQYHTPTTVMLAFGTIDSSVKRAVGKKGATKQQTGVYCLPSDVAWQRVQAARAQLQQAIDAFANELRQLGSYAKRLEAAGGIKAAPNPLSATVIMADDPDDDDGHYFVLNPIPRIEREQVTSHTPKMLHIERNGKPWSTSHQRNHFVCPNDAAWQAVQERRDAAQRAYEAWQALLRELGTYQAALADGRYARKEDTVAAPHTTTAHADTWHNLPPKLAGWKWEQNARTKEARLLGPDGWATKDYSDSNKAIAEALRRVNGQPAGALVTTEQPIAGVPMMDQAEARETLDRMRDSLGQIELSLSSFRQRALDFADRQGWKALGYSGALEAINAELGAQYSKSYLSRLLGAARIEKILELPIGNSVPETQLRPLATLDTPDQQRQAWQQANTATNGKPTTGAVQQAVQEIKPKPTSTSATLHPDYQHMIEVERILKEAASMGERTGTRLYQAAYDAARNIRDRDLYNRAFAMIDRAVDGTAAVEPPKPSAPDVAAPAHPLTVLTRPRRPQSADVSVQLSYLDQIESYATKLEQRVAELERQLAAPLIAREVTR